MATMTINVDENVFPPELRELAKAIGPERWNELLTDAISRLQRIYLGVDPPDGPSDPTWPFSKQYSKRPAEVVLRQIDATKFEVREPIKYADGEFEFIVPSGDRSDLTSVPRFLVWLVPRYGRHTLAALLHDYLQHRVIFRRTPRPEGPRSLTSEQADTIFRFALKHNNLPFLRYWLMWTAVTLRTEFKAGPLYAFGTVVWVAFFTLIGILFPPLLVINIFQGWFSLVPILIALGTVLVLPILGCILWLHRWRCGLISGLALIVFGFPTLLVALSVLLYLGIEWVVERFQKDKSPIVLSPPANRVG
jgi:Protein of unknown function (DUF1353)